MNSKRNKALKSLTGRSEASTLLILIIMIIIVACLQKGFFKWSTMDGYLNAFFPLIILAMGQGIVIIAGGLDMSCGTAMAMVLCVMTKIMNPNVSSSGVTALLVGLGVALLTGIVNGIVVGYLRLPPVIATYATSYVWLGIALFVTPTPGGQMTSWFKGFYDLRKIGFNASSKQVMPTALIWLLIACIIWAVVRRTKTGRYIYAVGSHNDNSYASGINTAKIQLRAYLLNSIFIYIVAVFNAAQNGSGSAHMGDTLTLQVIAAAIVGGIAMTGGKGNVYAAIAGALIMSFVSKIIYFAGITSAYQTLVSGLIIIAAIASSILYSVRQKKALLKGVSE